MHVNLSQMPVTIYSIENYKKIDDHFIKNNGVAFTRATVIKELKKDNYYHFRIHKNTQYTFFGDIDGYNDTIDTILPPRECPVAVNVYPAA